MDRPGTSVVLPEPLVSRLRDALGADAVLTDNESRRYYANDLFWQPGIEPAAIVIPPGQQGAAQAVALLADATIPIVPRGGAMSYTKGILPAVAGAAVVDCTRLNQVVEVNVADRYVTVEAGCTWADVSAALAGTGWRTAFWGPLSGRRATVGGALSQNAAFYGSARSGSVAETVIGLSVVLADGTTVTTGSAGRVATKPFTRGGGPDLTGLFIGDSGALGLKTTATLRLEPVSEHVGCLSFGFPSIAGMVRAQIELSSVGAISEAFGIDRNKIEESASFSASVSGARARGEAGKGTGLEDHPFTLHLAVEADTPAALEHCTDAVRRIACRHGVEILNTVPSGLRSHPFGPLRGILGRNGERWVPVHAIFPLSQAAEVSQRTEELLAGDEALLQNAGIVPSIMTMSIGSEFFIEPSFYWADEITPLHARTVGADVAATWTGREPNSERREVVIGIRRRLQQFFASLGGISWQAGRDYPFREVMRPETYALLGRLKRAVDPKGLMNPDALGL